MWPRNHTLYDYTNYLICISSNSDGSKKLPDDGRLLPKHVAVKHNTQNHHNPSHRPHNHTLYDIPRIRFVSQVTQTDPRSSLMMADYCRNMLEPVYRIKEWYKSLHSAGYFYSDTTILITITFTHMLIYVT